jgi:hypothetical protein
MHFPVKFIESDVKARDLFVSMMYPVASNIILIYDRKVKLNPFGTLCTQPATVGPNGAHV